jgi:hypothetical protein
VSLIVTCLFCMLLAPVAASGAAFVQLPPPAGTFGEDAEIQLGGTAAMAVNTTGAGGVKPGTVYVITSTPLEPRKVAMYSPTSGGSLEFAGAWAVPANEGEAYEHCGPSESLPHCVPRPSGNPRNLGLGIDQTTGGVFVLDAEGAGPGRKVIIEFSADGLKEVTRFGEMGLASETIAASPAKIHFTPLPDGLTVGPSGDVYVLDAPSVPTQRRLMVFHPVSGDPGHYEYAGQSHDIGATAASIVPSRPITDAAGNVYVNNEEVIQEYNPSQPSVPFCSYTKVNAQIAAMTVHPSTGEVFYYSAADREVHQLSACNGAGDFVEIGRFPVAPPRDDLSALAFDPARQVSVLRPPGALYGIAPEPTTQNGKGEKGKTALGYVFAPVEESPPKVGEESVSGVGMTTAELRAQVDPTSFDTRYFFQYLTDVAYQEAGETFEGAQEAPLGGGVLAAGKAPTPVAVTLSGLLPDTGYHYRVVARSNCSPAEPAKVCEVFGADQTFHTFGLAGSALPDQRAYELVSPAQKNGGQVLPADPQTRSCPTACKPGFNWRRFPMQASPDGGAVVYEGMPFSPAGLGAPIENEYMSRRTGSGWETVNLTPQLMIGSGGYVAFDTGLSHGLISQLGVSFGPPAPPEFANVYRQPTTVPSSLMPMLSDSPLNHTPFNRSANSPNRFEMSYRGSSTDLARVFFAANDALTEATPDAPAAVDGGPLKDNLYEWHDGTLSLVNVAPGNATTTPGARFGSGTNVVSADGSRAFWSDEASQLFVRISGHETVEIEHPGKFLSASADGTKVLLDDGCLYDVASKSCEDLTTNENEVHQGGFAGLAGQSEDLSHVYFVIAPTKGSGDLTGGSTSVTDVHATSGAFNVGQAIVGAGIPAGTTIAAVGSGTIQLSAAATASGNDVALTAQGLLAGEGENSEGAKAQVTGFNLYAWEEGGATSFVATLASQDSAAWTAALPQRTAEGSPHGTWLAFPSVNPLTGSDNVGCGAGGKAPCGEVFLYDSATAKLSCPSCNPSNASPLGPSTLRTIGGTVITLSQPRYLTDSGRLYFDSQDALVPADTNGNVEDVYQYEPEGIGSCQREGGCVSMISAGREQDDSNFLTMDESGDNVFFTTTDQLVPADTDEFYDLYDARVGGVPGGFSPPPQVTTGEPPFLPAPPEGTPSSMGFVGPESKPARGCKKGQVKRGGKCRKKPKHGKKNAGGSAKNRGRGGAK